MEGYGMFTLLLGSTGLLGYDLYKVFPGAFVPTHKLLDITDNQKMSYVIRKAKPDVVICAAGFSSLQHCEVDKELALRVNATSLKAILGACKRIGSTFVYYSSDLVFDGLKSPYLENDKTHPKCAFGLSKSTAESIIQSTDCDYRIIRTSLLFGSGRDNFINKILQKSYMNNMVRVASDVKCQITYTADLAVKTEEIINMDSGIYNVTNEGVCSWYDIASAITANAISSKPGLHDNDKYRHSILKNTKTTPMRSWKEALKTYVAELV